jgi:hypothetical protein
MVMKKIMVHRTGCFAALSMTAGETVTLSAAKGLGCHAQLAAEALSH